MELTEPDATGEFPVLPMTPPDPEGVRVVGDVVSNRYVLRKHLGRGRYGEVYEAVDRSFSDPQLGREHAVALHLLSEPVSLQAHVLEKLEACYREPQLWSHPNIVEVGGFGCDRGQFFVVMDLLFGVSLRSVLDDAPGELLSDEETFAVIRGVGDALKYGHAKGAVHGGIRPEKVFITANHAVKVLDYLPTTVPRMAPFFVEDAVTLAAPEERDDVYGLACLAYELLTGTHPYNSNTPLEAWNARLTPVPIARIGERRWGALARALARRGDRRTANVATFLADFQIKGYEKLRPAGDPVSVREPTSPTPHARRLDDDTRGDRQEPRRGHWRFTAVLALVAAVVGATFWFFEPVQRRAEQWLAHDLPRASGELPPLTRGPSPGARVDAVVTSTPWTSGATASDAIEPETRTEPPAQPAPEQIAAPGTHAPSPEVIEVTAGTVTVSEGEGVARAVIRRRGGVLGASSIVWWASEGTASADDDYGNLGVQVERFDVGADTHTLYLPIANDSMHESRESVFVNVRAGEDSGRRAEPAQRIEILIADDD